MEIIYELKYLIPKKDFKDGLFDLVFKEAKHKNEVGNNKYIQIPSSVTSIGLCAFANCNSLISITIPSSVTCIGDRAFANCNGLTFISIPSSVTSIGDWAFANCNGLTFISIPKKFESDMNTIFKNLDLLNIEITYI